MSNNNDFGIDTPMTNIRVVIVPVVAILFFSSLLALSSTVPTTRAYMYPVSDWQTGVQFQDSLNAVGASVNITSFQANSNGGFFYWLGLTDDKNQFYQAGIGSWCSETYIHWGQTGNNSATCANGNVLSPNYPKITSPIGWLKVSIWLSGGVWYYSFVFKNGTSYSNSYAGNLGATKISGVAGIIAEGGNNGTSTYYYSPPTRVEFTNPTIITYTNYVEKQHVWVFNTLPSQSLTFYRTGGSVFDGPLNTASFTDSSMCPSTGLYSYGLSWNNYDTTLPPFGQQEYTVCSASTSTQTTSTIFVTRTFYSTSTVTLAKPVNAVVSYVNATSTVTQTTYT